MPAALQLGTPPCTVPLSGALQVAGGFRGAEDESLGGLLSALPSLCRMVWRARSLSPIAGGCGGQRVEGALQLNFGNGPSHPQWPAGTWCQEHDAGPSKPPALAV